MILLISASARARECAAALEAGTGHKTQVATSVPQALARLRADEYDALAIDQVLLEADFRALDTLLNHSGVATPVHVNLGLHSCERILRETQAALRRAEKEKGVAMRAAERVLRNELRNEITGILLTSQVAMRRVTDPVEVTAKLELVHDMAEKMRARLRVL